MNTQNRVDVTPVQIHADHAVERRLGKWTSAGAFQVLARLAQVTVGLRSPLIPTGDIGLDMDLDHAAVKLLAVGDTVIDHRELVWTGRGRSSGPTTIRPTPAAGLT